MEKGRIIHHFEILETVELPELKAKGIWARHASGAELFHVLNDDPENLFAFAFATPPEDSTGAAHILEHSVLCGSERYPLKDAFLVLAQGSLQTFLNAWTFPDKTVYPASSVNEKDYFNIMAVYGDAVFRPLLSEWTFMQEGWRLEKAAAHKGPRYAYTGVVYNEMKGAYSSPDSYAALWSVKAVMPDTVYAFESGGDPEHIPDLTWEGLKEFHRSRYSPGNCKLFLAGNIPTEKQMEYLDRVCLSGLAPGKPLPRVERAAPWKAQPGSDASRLIRVPCPGGEESKPQVFLSWLCSDSAEPAKTTALNCLTEILLGHDGSPLTRALLESGLGEDLSPCSGLEGELRETVFCVGLRGVEESEKTYRAMEELIFTELRRLVKEGIPKEEIDAALLSIEFSHREIRRSHGPYSLVWLRRSLRGWLNGTKPWEALLFVPNFTELKRRLAENGRYFEGLIEEYLLNNRHRALVAVESEDGFLEKKENAAAARLAEKEKSLSSSQKKEIEEKACELEKMQAEGESPESLAAIPHLSRSDLTPRLDIIPSELRAPNVLCHPLFTNGITYADIAFPVDVLDSADYPWLPFFARAVVSMGLPGMDYAQASSLLARTTGGFHAALETGSVAPPAPGSSSLVAPAPLLGRDWIIYRLKALDEKAGDAFGLVQRLITRADFSDLRRLRDLIVEMKNDGDSSVAPAGHSYALGRSGRAASRPRAVDDLWNGLWQIPFSHEMAAMDPAEVSKKLFTIRDALAAKAGVFINLTCAAESLDGAVARALETFGRFGQPAAPNPRCLDIAPFLAQLDSDSVLASDAATASATAAVPGAAATASDAAEVWVSPSMQIGFAALSLPAAPYGSREQAAETVFSHELSTGALWESIRMKGGAYAAFARPDNLEGIFSLATYRDPDPLRSLSVIPEVLRKVSKAPPASRRAMEEDLLEKAIIGSFARETAPRTPADNGFTAFLRYLYGITAEHRYRRILDMVDLKLEECSAVASRLADAAGKGRNCSPVIIAGPKEAEKAAKALGVAVRNLPV